MKKTAKKYQKILLNAEYVSPVMYSGDALFHLGRYQEAMNYYEKGLKLLNEIGYRSLRDYPESVRNIEFINQPLCCTKTLQKELLT